MGLVGASPGRVEHGYFRHMNLRAGCKILSCLSCGADVYIPPEKRFYEVHCVAKVAGR
jgi:hypothetical protein